MLREKLCFVISIICLLTSVHFSTTRPALVLYMFTALFVFAMIVRVIEYWHSNYLLFMLDMCYFINTFSLVLIWVFPTNAHLLRIQFALANGHAYCGAFLYRNALVFSDFQKLVSAFIHILPVLFSFLLRWFPMETSVWWYCKFINTGAKSDALVFMADQDWFYSMLIPLLIFTAREILYYLIIYGFIKPDEKYLDSFRYMHKKKMFVQLFWSRFHPRWHLIIWILFGVIGSAVVLCASMLAWSSYLFHSSMLVIQLIAITWNAACYYVDYYPIELHRRFQLQQFTPNDHMCSSAIEQLAQSPNHHVEPTIHIIDTQADPIPIYLPLAMNSVGEG